MRRREFRDNHGGERTWVFAATAHLAAIGRTGLSPNSATGEGQKKLLHEGLLCFMTIRIKLLLDKDKTVFFFFFFLGKGKE